MRHNRSQTGNRRSHHALKQPGISACKDCGSMKRKHTVCPVCGKYENRVVVDVHARLAKKEKKEKKETVAK